MDLHFGTPARLERQIAQDLMQEQSEFDLSLPGGDTRDISASISRTPLAPSNRHNSSFSRPSDSSDASTPAKHTRLDRPLATTLPVTLAAAVHNASTQPSQEHHHPISASSSTSSVSDSPHSAHFPDPYTHVRSTSPPLTSTPHRTVGAASTVGSRSRTMTARPLAEAASTQRYDDTTKTSAASRAARSSRSASALLDDLTESSIAPEDATDAHTDRIHNTSSAPSLIPISSTATTWSYTMRHHPPPPSRSNILRPRAKPSTGTSAALSVGASSSSTNPLSMTTTTLAPPKTHQRRHPRRLPSQNQRPPLRLPRPNIQPPPTPAPPQPGWCAKASAPLPATHKPNRRPARQSDRPPPTLLRPSRRPTRRTRAHEAVPPQQRQSHRSHTPSHRQIVRRPSRGARAAQSTGTAASDPHFALRADCHHP